MNNSPNAPNNFDTPPASDFYTEIMEDASIPYNGEEYQAVTNSEVLRVKQVYEAQLLEIDGVVGIGIQQNEIGDEVIWVYLRDEAVRRYIPSELEGISVVTEVTGQFESY